MVNGIVGMFGDVADTFVHVVKMSWGCRGHGITIRKLWTSRACLRVSRACRGDVVNVFVGVVEMFVDVAVMCAHVGRMP